MNILPLLRLPGALLLLWVVLCPAPPAWADGFDCLCRRVIALSTCKPESEFSLMEAREGRYIYNGFYASGYAEFRCLVRDGGVVVSSPAWPGHKVAASYSVDRQNGRVDAVLRGVPCGATEREIHCSSPELKYTPPPKSGDDE